ncbi:MAG: zinc ribbon domain-containing protein [Caldilineaceae bacterium]|nr:zinc ribbon domain-containing protein [Caldilineaceae bacterium]
MNRKDYLHHRLAGQRTPLIALAICLITALTLLSACGGDVREELTLRSGERWKMEVRITLSPNELMFIGDPAEIEARLDEQGNAPDAAATNYKWSKEPSDDGGVVYIVEQSGKGFQRLNSAAFDDLATFSSMTYGDKDAVYFAFNPVSSFSDFGYYEFVLHSGETLETNGELLDDGAVRWVGAYQPMEATIRLSKGVDPLVIAGAVMLVIVVAGGLLLFRQRQRQQNVQAVMAHSAYCHQCGARMETTGVFCPSCGTRRL